jgi:hypothetical protein
MYFEYLWGAGGGEVCGGVLRFHKHVQYCNHFVPIRTLCSVVLPNMLSSSPNNPHAGQRVTVLQHRAHHLQCCFCN